MKSASKRSEESLAVSSSLAKEMRLERNTYQLFDACKKYGSVELGGRPWLYVCGRPASIPEFLVHN
jgi:hypothetical protein